VGLRPGFTGDAALEEALRGHVRSGLGGCKAPRRFSFLPELPETSTGKVSRKALRAMLERRAAQRATAGET